MAAPKTPQSEQCWAVVDATGALISVGTVVANPLRSGLSKVKVDGPSNGRPWDPQAKAWGEIPAPAEPEPTVTETVLPILAGIAADESKTRDERVDAILAALAAVAPDSP
jgi:hypothetical protein